jgi:RNA polymerase sigma-70 factor (ECF subfamily)
MTRIPEAAHVASSIPNRERHPDEAALIDRARRGDRSAFAALVEHYWDRLHRWLYHLAHDSHAAEDLAQETCLKAFAGLKTFQPGTNFAGWLFRIAHNSFANYYRAQRRGEALPEDLATNEDGPLDQAQANEALEELGRALNRVPPEFRAALLLRAEEGLSFREIADVLGLTEETARWRVFKARQKLMTLLAPRQEQEKP